MKFKVGDKVKCIRRIGYQLTKIGSVYTVNGYRELAEHNKKMVNCLKELKKLVQK